MKAEKEKWQSMLKKAEADQMALSAKTDFKSKQQLLDLEHQISVDKIKSDIYNDRTTFLQNLIKIETEPEP